MLGKERETKDQPTDRGIHALTRDFSTLTREKRHGSSRPDPHETRISVSPELWRVGSGRVRRISNPRGSGRVGSGGFQNLGGRDGSGEEAFKISRVGSGRVKTSRNSRGSGRVGSRRLEILTCRVGSGQDVSKFSRVGSGRVKTSRNSHGSGRLGRVSRLDPTRPARFDPTREKPCFFFSGFAEIRVRISFRCRHPTSLVVGGGSLGRCGRTARPLSGRGYNNRVRTFRGLSSQKRVYPTEIWPSSGRWRPALANQMAS